MKKIARFVLVAVMIFILFFSALPSMASSQEERESLQKTIQLVGELKEKYSEVEKESQETREFIDRVIILLSGQLSSSLVAKFRDAVSAGLKYSDFLIQENKKDLNSLVLTEDIFAGGRKIERLVEVLKNAGNDLPKIAHIHIFLLEELRDVFKIADGKPIDIDAKVRRVIDFFNNLEKDYFE